MGCSGSVLPSSRRASLDEDKRASRDDMTFVRLASLLLPLHLETMINACVHKRQQ